MSDTEAFEAFTKIRFSDNGGEPFCPDCGCVEPYFISTLCKWKCRACHKNFSATFGTIFASRKMAFVDLLAAICIFINCAKGISALQLSRDLDCQYKTAYVLSHKLREAMARGNDAVTLARQRRYDMRFSHARQASQSADSARFLSWCHCYLMPRVFRLERGDAALQPAMIPAIV